VTSNVCVKWVFACMFGLSSLKEPCCSAGVLPWMVTLASRALSLHDLLRVDPQPPLYLIVPQQAPVTEDPMNTETRLFELLRTFPAYLGGNLGIRIPQYQGIRMLPHTTRQQPGSLGNLERRWLDVSVASARVHDSDETPGSWREDTRPPWG
jgi:hypothetical protein